MTPRLGPGCPSCFRNGVSRSLWDVEGPCWQPAAILSPALGRRAQRSPFCVPGVAIAGGQISQDPALKKEGILQESFQSNLFRKLFSEREANISLHNPFQCFAVFTATNYLGFSPLNSRLLLIPHFPRAGTVSLQSVLTGFSQDTSKLFSFIQNTSCSRSSEAFFP